MKTPKDIVLRRVLVGHRAAVNVVDFDDRYIVSASGDRTIKVCPLSICVCVCYCMFWLLIIRHDNLTILHLVSTVRVGCDRKLVHTSPLSATVVHVDRFIVHSPCS